jgi:MFS family permease
VSLIFDGFGFGALAMLTESLLALNVDPDERARIMAIVLVIIMAATAPFGWIGGMLSDISKELPFVLNLCLLGAGVLITLIFYAKNPHHGREQNTEHRES